MATKPKEPIKKKPPTKEESFRSFREGVESVVIAIVLAFLFRAFEAEAFVIPTGSMAPTLQGRHKDISCEACNYQYRTGDSFDRSGNFRVHWTVCPMCQFATEIMDGERNEPIYASHRSHTGDRILVNKFAYQEPFGEPKRWDVIVFKFPNNAKQNYIKRLIGLPNEEITIRHGDIFTDSPAPRSIARKPPEKLPYILQVVNDSNYIPAEFEKFGWPSNWQAQGDAWETANYGKSFSCQASDQTSWIQFQQYDLSPQTWEDWGNGRAPKADPMLITDFYTYNTRTQDRSPPAYAQTHGFHWVGDLAVEAEMEVVSGQGAIELVLIEAGRQHQCKIDISSGQATLSIDGGSVQFDPNSNPAAKLTAETKLNGAGTYKIRFANVDNQLTLWIDDQVVDFGQQAIYEVSGNELPTNEDLSPIRIGASSAELKVKDLRVLRDVYYVAVTDQMDIHFDYDANLNGNTLRAAMKSPEAYSSFLASRRAVQFKLQEDEFFPLGDNSPMSKDGRLWDKKIGQGNGVHRDMLIGKAVLVYWPHPIHVKIPFTNITLPAFPNFKQMKLIR